MAVDPVASAEVGVRLLEAVAVIDRLRSPGGCAWDGRQTHSSLVEYLVEETYEAVEAIETGSEADLREELGDVLLQVLFHARIAQERDDAPWSIDDVAGGLVDKLVTRHPHVFGPDGTPPALDELDEAWAARKAREKGRESVTDGVPTALPALVLASKLLGRARTIAVAVPGVEQSAAAYAEAPDADSLGALLLALSADARARGLDPEAALRAALRGYRAEVRSAEGLPDGA